MKKNNKIWLFPWSYSEGFIISITLFITGVLIEIMTKGKGLPTISWPINIYVIIVFTSLLISAFAFFKRSQIIRWLTGIPATITAILLITFNVIIMGIIPQDGNPYYQELDIYGLTHIANSWQFYLSILFFLSCLGLTIIKSVFYNFKEKFGIILNHFGLWLVIVSASLGTGDLLRLKMNTFEGRYSWIAFDDENEYELDFAFKLNDFHLEQYSPKLAIIDRETGKIDLDLENNLTEVADNLKLSIDEYQIEVIEFVKEAAFDGTNYVYYNGEGSNPAVKVKLETKDTVIVSWISCGSFSMPSKILDINVDHSLAMTIPQAKEFRSDLEFLSKDGKKKDIVLKVNDRFNFGIWNIYQLSYDKDFGKDSKLSVLEIIKDPWLPVVYTGIFIMIAGAIYLVWTGRSKNEVNNGLE